MCFFGANKAKAVLASLKTALIKLTINAGV